MHPLILILGASAWLALMGVAILIPINARVLRFTQAWVCPKGVKMEVEYCKLSYHQPSERGLVAFYRDSHGEIHSVRTKAVFALWFLLFLFWIPWCVLAFYLWG